MTDQLTTVAVLDDEPKMREALRRLLGAHGYQVEGYECGDEFFAALATHPPDCLVLDLQMPGINGFEVLAMLRQQRLTTPVVVLTARDEMEAKERTRLLGAAEFLTKPVDGAALIDAIESAIHRP